MFVMVMEVFVFHLLLDHDGFVNFFLHDLFLLDHGRLVVVVYGFHFRVHVLLLFHFDRYVDDDFPPFAANRKGGGMEGRQIMVRHDRTRTKFLV